MLLFDGDLGLANIDIQLGLLPQHDLASLLAGRASLDQAVVRHPAGFDILAGRSGSGSLAARASRMMRPVSSTTQMAVSSNDTSNPAK